MGKSTAIWLSVLTILYFIHLVAGLIQGARIRNLQARLKRLEAKAGSSV
jgi:hypothetical protein